MRRLLYYFFICLFFYFFISSFTLPVEAVTCTNTDCNGTNCGNWHYCSGSSDSSPYCSCYGCGGSDEHCCVVKPECNTGYDCQNQHCTTTEAGPTNTPTPTTSCTNANCAGSSCGNWRHCLGSAPNCACYNCGGSGQLCCDSTSCQTGFVCNYVGSTLRCVVAAATATPTPTTSCTNANCAGSSCGNWRHCLGSAPNCACYNCGDSGQLCCNSGTSCQNGFVCNYVGSTLRCVVAEATATPTPTRSPTATPSALTWIKLKDTSFISSYALVMPVPAAPIAYDADDAGLVYFISSNGGLVSIFPFCGILLFACARRRQIHTLPDRLACRPTGAVDPGTSTEAAEQR
jgi:hypothetical protein